MGVNSGHITLALTEHALTALAHNKDIVAEIKRSNGSHMSEISYHGTDQKTQPGIASGGTLLRLKRSNQGLTLVY